MLKIKVILIHMLQNYQFTTNLKFDELKLNFSVSLRLHNKHLVKITERRLLENQIKSWAGNSKL
jgi:hypothetical protein